MNNVQNTEPLVSINCITYNHEAYIRNALEGFLMQKTNFTFEILIHDDASTDQTANIIRQYENEYPGIIKPIYQKENQYSKKVDISEQFQYSRTLGKYTAICEGDDYWIDPLKLQKQVDFLEDNPEFSMCCHDAIILWENKQKRPRLFAPAALPSVLGMEDILKGWFIPTASILYRSKILHQRPKWLNKVLNGDYFLQLLCAHHGKIKYFDELMSVYRKDLYGNSLSATVLQDNKYRYEQMLFLLDSFNKETKYIHNELIEQAKTVNTQNYKTRLKKKKYGPFHYLYKPLKSLQSLIKIIKNR